MEQAPLVPLSRLVRRPEPQSAATDIDIAALENALKRDVRGEVRFDDGARGLYAMDASNYWQVPIGVVIPRVEEDVVAAVAVCRRFGAPILSRAGGTALAGQTCNTAVVIDWSKYMNRVLELDPTERHAWVEPGVICDDLVSAAHPYELTYGPDPATHNHCCFGGMLGNNSCGIHAQMAGKTVDNTLEMDVLLYDGTRLRLGWTDERREEELIRQGGRVGQIHAQLKSIRQRYEAQIQAKFPAIPRRVSGYNLDQLLADDEGRFNLARSLVGSEGTCVTILKAKMRLVFSHPQRVVLLLGYEDVCCAGDHVPDVLRFSPIGLEGLDRRLIDNVVVKGGPHRKYLPLLPPGGGWLIVEFGAGTKEEAERKAHELMAELGRAHDRPSMRLLDSQQEQHGVWKIRESGLGATAFVPGHPDSWPGWEDSAVPPDKVGVYLRALRQLFDKYGYDPSLYGHFGQGCIHCRIDFDLLSQAGLDRWKAFLEEAATLVVRFGGSLSGEHGDGQARGWLLDRMFGSEIVQAFREFKSIWDPDGKMNPGKVVDAFPVDANLRLGAHYQPWEPNTHFRYPNDGGSFAHAALRCVGIGKCRRLSGEGEDDVMCPSFMVTREEMHTTRGRAHLLWEMLQNHPIGGGWKDEHVKEALDLCLSCKGCKGDCPVNVDIATYKAEFLSHYWEGRVRPRSSYAFGLIDRWARVASLAPGFVNLCTQLPGLRNVAKALAGMPQDRTIPAFAPETFRAWFRRREPRNEGHPKVLLWADTFNNYFYPETAKAAVEVLEATGHQVVVPKRHLCCGRPLYDYGMLDLAKRYLLQVLDALREPIEQGLPVVVLEPSCCSVFRDEMNELYDREDAKRLSAQTVLLSEFLQKQGDAYRPPALHRKAIGQGHCHHKSIMRFDAEQKLLSAMGLEFDLLNAGCCGMAGSFGFEKEKYPISIAAGERALLPAVRDASATTLVLADGFSCREQIAQGTDRHALHLAQVLKLAMAGEQAVAEEYPEAAIVQARTQAQRRSMIRAAVVVGALAAFAVGLRLRRPRRIGR